MAQADFREKVKLGLNHIEPPVEIMPCFLPSSPLTKFQEQFSFVLRCLSHLSDPCRADVVSTSTCVLQCGFRYVYLSSCLLSVARMVDLLLVM